MHSVENNNLQMSTNTETKVIIKEEIDIKDDSNEKNTDGSIKDGANITLGYNTEKNTKRVRRIPKRFIESQIEIKPKKKTQKKIIKSKNNNCIKTLNKNPLPIGNLIEIHAENIKKLGK